MARGFFHYNGVTVTPAANPTTLYQILAAANRRTVLHGIEVMPLGATAATAPLLFDICLQDDANGLVIAADATKPKDWPEMAETVQTTVLQQNGGEPTTSTVKREFSLHQMGTRAWVSIQPFKEIIIPGGVRMGVRYLNATFVPVRMSFSLEE